ncbi:MAG: metallophosphoesterase [Bacteroidia bacterium]
MKKILLISDTHGYLEPNLIPHIKEVDEVWHAGDIGAPDVCLEIQKTKPVRAVYGNIDGGISRVIYKEYEFFECENVSVLITHIAGYPGTYNSKVKTLINKFKPKLVICGHSHILKVIYDKHFKHLHINPGAAGKHGFHLVKTAVLFNIDKEEIKDLRIVELGKRA